MDRASFRAGNQESFKACQVTRDRSTYVAQVTPRTFFYFYILGHRVILQCEDTTGLKCEVKTREIEFTQVTLETKNEVSSTRDKSVPYPDESEALMEQVCLV